MVVGWYHVKLKLILLVFSPFDWGDKWHGLSFHSANGFFTMHLDIVMFKNLFHCLFILPAFDTMSLDFIHKLGVWSRLNGIDGHANRSGARFCNQQALSWIGRDLLVSIFRFDGEIWSRELSRDLIYSPIWPWGSSIHAWYTITRLLEVRAPLMLTKRFRGYCSFLWTSFLLKALRQIP